MCEAGLRFGFGGVTAPDDAGLPVPPDLVLAQYPRLGARSAWIARSFFRGGVTPDTLASRLHALRTRIAWWSCQPPPILLDARSALRRAVADLRAAR